MKKIMTKKIEWRTKPLPLGWNELLRNAKALYEMVDYYYEDLKKAENRIAELEKDNAYKQEHIELWFKKNEEKKKRIAELEKEIKENAFYSKGYAQGIKNTYEVVVPEKLKQFAERLKEKFDEQKYFYETASISHRDISLTALIRLIDV